MFVMLGSERKQIVKFILFLVFTFNLIIPRVDMKKIKPISKNIIDKFKLGCVLY